MIEHDKSLKALNTFGFDQRAAHFVEVSDDAMLEDVVREADRLGWPLFLLGGGSNLVLTHDIPGLVVQFGEPSTHYTELGDGTAQVVASAAVTWHDLVLDTVARGLAGLENLSLIPGTVGAAPVQNIGAYGVELRDTLVWLDAYDLHAREWRRFMRDDCGFGYRDSRFKREPGRYAIARVALHLERSDRARHTGYRALNEALTAAGIDSPTPRQVSETVIAIRRSKLPDPAVLGNAGSFFQNPVIPRAQFEALKQAFPDLVAFPDSSGPGGHGTDGSPMKLAAGWLLDSLGFRGYREGAIGTHAEQALVLVHEGGSDGRALMEMAGRIAARVREVYGVTLVVEPVVV